MSRVLALLVVALLCSCRGAYVVRGSPLGHVDDAVASHDLISARVSLAAFERECRASMVESRLLGGLVGELQRGALRECEVRLLDQVPQFANERPTISRVGLYINCRADLLFPLGCVAPRADRPEAQHIERLATLVGRALRGVADSVGNVRLVAFGTVDQVQPSAGRRSECEGPRDEDYSECARDGDDARAAQYYGWLHADASALANSRLSYCRAQHLLDSVTDELWGMHVESVVAVGLSVSLYQARHPSHFSADDPDSRRVELFVLFDPLQTIELPEACSTQATGDVALLQCLEECAELRSATARRVTTLPIVHGEPPLPCWVCNDRDCNDPIIAWAADYAHHRMEVVRRTPDLACRQLPDRHTEPVRTEGVSP